MVFFRRYFWWFLGSGGVPWGHGWAGQRDITSVSGSRHFGPPFSGDEKASLGRQVEAKMKVEIAIQLVYEFDREKGCRW